MSEYFTKPNSLGSIIKVGLDLYNYATKTDLKNATGVDTFAFLKKNWFSWFKSGADNLDIRNLKYVPSGLYGLECKIDGLHVEKLVPVPVDLFKLRNLAKNYVVIKLYTMLRYVKILKKKCLILLT